MSRWTEWVKSWATKHNTTYGCALSQPDCSAEYRKKYGLRKKLSQKKERELMGLQDVNIALPKKKKRPPLIIEEDDDDEEERKQKSKQNKERFGMTVEDILSRDLGKMEQTKVTKKKALKEMTERLGDKKRLAEMSRMMGEDYNVQLKPLLKRMAKPISQDELDKKRNELMLKQYVSKYNRLKKKLTSISTTADQLTEVGKEIDDFYQIYNLNKGRKVGKFLNKIKQMYNELAKLFNEFGESDSDKEDDF